MAAEGYGPAQKFFVYRDADGWCISCRLWPERRSRDEQGLLRTGFSMSGKRHPHVAQLTLVATANADESQPIQVRGAFEDFVRQTNERPIDLRRAHQLRLDLRQCHPGGF